MAVVNAFIGALLSGLALVPAIRWLSLRVDVVSRPRADRWHTSPTPALGGVAIFLAFLLGLSLQTGRGELRAELVVAAGLMFLLGLVDDLRRITPPTKLILQIMAASVLIYFGYRIDFFPWTVPNILLTFVWLVGLTNAFNLLDNMDGLAAGVGLIAGGFLSYFFWQAQDLALLSFSLALVGSGLAFLFFNFPPARIFMGNSGSLFLGFALAALAIARTPRASNVFAVMGVPTLLLLLPIVDTSLVTITRLLRGQSPVQGGSDHTSHRLVAFGLSERQAVLVLYAIALASGIAGTVLETLDYDLSLVLIPLLLVALALLTAYLGGLQVVSPQAPPRAGAFTRLMADLTFRRRLLEVGLDFLLIGIAFYLAVWTRFGFRLGEGELDRFGRALPIALVAVLLVHFLLGVYRGVWRYVGWRICCATLWPWPAASC
jgi:UDP-GlcNAc:undecaprenyl-phosphate GlcNAc-1-phosphate transferase